MGFQFFDLDARTRKLMADEMELDRAADTLYMSHRLSPRGQADWPDLLKEAIRSGTDVSLADSLRINGRLNTTEQKRKPKGGFTVADVPITAPETLAEGEFNRFYARAICLRAIEDNIESVKVYRAKQVTSPRSASEAKIGTSVNAQALLADIRNSPGVEPALGLPPGPNSGLSIQLPQT